MKKVGEIIADMKELKNPKAISVYIDSLGTKELINLQLFCKDMDRICSIKLGRKTS